MKKSIIKLLGILVISLIIAVIKLVYLPQHFFDPNLLKGVDDASHIFTIIYLFSNLIILSFQILTVAFFLFLGSRLLFSKEYKFNIFFNITLNAEYVMLVYQGLIMLLCYYGYGNNHAIVPIDSILVFFDSNSLELWIQPLLRIFSIQSLLYIITLIIYSKKYLNNSFKESTELIIFSYLMPSFVLICISSFFTMNTL